MPEPHPHADVNSRTDLTPRYCRNPRVAQQVLEGRAVVLHYEGKRILGLNDTGTLVWSLLDGRRTLEQVAQEASLRSGANLDEVGADVAAFVEELRLKDLVLEVEPLPADD